MTDIKWVNALCRGENEVQIHFLTHPEEDKSDAFIITSRTQAGLTVCLQDGGWSKCNQLEALLTLRREILTAAGMADRAEDPSYKLEITSLISHFHIDHVEALMEQVIPCPFIAIRAAYYPACSQLEHNKKYPDTNNGDLHLRPQVLAALTAYQPQAEKHERPFGSVCTVPFGAAQMELIMPGEDWGTEELADYAAELYFATKPDELHPKLGIPIVNANCLWTRVEMAGKVILLTGDTMKRSWTAEDESMDRVMALYGDKLEADIVKYPHHGVLRNEAWKNVQKLLKKSENACVVLTGNKGRQESGVYLTENNIPWVDINNGTVAFSITEAGLKRL